MATITIDTNVLARLLIKDDSAQWQIAAQLLALNHFTILPTVLLETEWVLKSVAGYPRAKIQSLFRSLLASGDFVFPDRRSIFAALHAYEGGMDFADAMHLCCVADDSTFVTFDRDLVRRAKTLMPNASVELAV